MERRGNGCGCPWVYSAVRKSPSASLPDGRNSPAARLLERADLALRMQRFAEAEQIAADVLKASRTNVVAVSILARALLAQNRGGEAITSLERAVRRGADPGLETLLATVLAAAGRTTDAIAQLGQTTQRRPPFLPAFQELARQLAMAGRVEEAILVAESAIALAPQAADLQLDLSRLHLYRNHRDKARASLAKAHEAAPGRSDILSALARILFQDGDYAAAADVFRRALALSPEDAMARADLAACLLEMGDRDAGEACLRAAYQGRPQMLARTTKALASASHGRFFLRPSALAKFLRGETT
jgi:tetratricopeptide (TPR) repeat protein